MYQRPKFERCWIASTNGSSRFVERKRFQMLRRLHNHCMVMRRLRRRLQRRPYTQDDHMRRVVRANDPINPADRLISLTPIRCRITTATRSRKHRFCTKKSRAVHRLSCTELRRLVRPVPVPVVVVEVVLHRPRPLHPPRHRDRSNENSPLRVQAAQAVQAVRRPVRSVHPSHRFDRPLQLRRPQPVRIYHPRLEPPNLIPLRVNPHRLHSQPRSPLHPLHHQLRSCSLHLHRP